MHQDFARWYSTVQMGDNKERREARWNGVRGIVEEAEWADIEALIRLAFATKQAPPSDAVQKFRQAFRNADETFEMRGNDRELQVLTGACLALLMEEGGDIGAQTALTVTTTGLAGARASDLPSDLSVLAEDAISQIAGMNRERPDLGGRVSRNKPSANVKEVITKISVEAATEKLKASPNWQGMSQAISLIGNEANQAFLVMQQAISLIRDETNKAFSLMSRQHTETIQSLEGYLRIQDEELQMLWWLTGQRSWDYDCAFSAVPENTRPLVLAKELSDSTQFLPGPPSIKALLSRAGLQEQEDITIMAAVNAADSTWLREVIGSMEPSPVSTPLHFAIRRQLETGAGDAWIENWAAVTGVDAGFALPALTLGTLFYRERLLLLRE
uniref:GTPase-associated system helical domain-containing protein n=1 Tax=Candidatus Kentrum sp. FW TaxID=2126338 RepID=A0A450TWX0_9GAMM|nr:MAG: hypothetical protein BECKFW1821C_GA0114237_10535 [Candidatus Kentron sp. FW]